MKKIGCERSRGARGEGDAADGARKLGPFSAPPKRNPLVAAAILRKAGSHRKPHKALRRAAKSRKDEAGGG